MVDCDCVSYHSPITRHIHRHHVHPLGMGGPDIAENIIRICPNAHTNIHVLIRLWGYRYDGEPPWDLRRRFSPFVRDMAEEGYRKWDEAGRPVEQSKWIWQGNKAAFDISSLTLQNVLTVPDIKWFR